MLSREAQLNDIMKFIIDNEAKVERILQQLEWTAVELGKESSNTDNELKSPREEKGDANDPLYPPSYPWEHSVTLDKTTLNGIINSHTPKEVPNKFSDSQVNFNREEKVLIYEHVIKRTGKLLEPELSVTFSQEEGIKRKMTFAEIVALKRDVKRRRIKHRTTRDPPLSHTEEVRNLIDVQMQALGQYLHPEKYLKDNTSDKNKPGPSRVKSKKDDNDKERSPERSRSRSKERWYYKKKESKKNWHRHSLGEGTTDDSLLNHKKNSKKTKRHKSRDSEIGLY